MCLIAHRLLRFWRACLAGLSLHPKIKLPDSRAISNLFLLKSGFKIACISLFAIMFSLTICFIFSTPPNFSNICRSSRVMELTCSWADLSIATSIHLSNHSWLFFKSKYTAGITTSKMTKDASYLTADEAIELSILLNSCTIEDLPQSYNGHELRYVDRVPASILDG